MYEIRHYLTASGRDIYQEWQQSLRDTKARIAIDRRINDKRTQSADITRACEHWQDWQQRSQS